jgi:methylisocitrate lyase
MLFTKRTAADKRAAFRAALAGNKLLRFPGAHAPLVALEAQRLGFDGLYISGAALAADLGLPDIGLTTLTEVAARGQQIARVVELPALIDADTGFGEPMNAARAVQTLEEAGLAGCHIEDQVAPKRCGHLDNKAVLAPADMAKKIKAAIEARRDPNFLIMARTDARGVEGLEKAIDRAKAYADAGADAIFPEALASPAEFEAMRKAVTVPLLANMTEFGKSPLLTAAELQNLGYNMVIYPVTSLRLAMGAIRRGFTKILEAGGQADIVPDMLTRAELYELLRYEEYNEFDQNLYNFKL